MNDVFKFIAENFADELAQAKIIFFINDEGNIGTKGYDPNGNEMVSGIYYTKDNWEEHFNSWWKVLNGPESWEKSLIPTRDELVQFIDIVHELGWCTNPGCPENAKQNTEGYQSLGDILNVILNDIEQGMIDAGKASESEGDFKVEVSAMVFKLHGKEAVFFTDNGSIENFDGAVFNNAEKDALKEARKNMMNMLNIPADHYK